jgi:hypothetical protein
MKRSKFSDEQIIGILREQGAGGTMADLCRRHGIGTGTCLGPEGEVRRLGGLRCQAAEGARGRGRQAQAASGRCHARWARGGQIGPVDRSAEGRAEGPAVKGGQRPPPGARPWPIS